MRSSLPDNTDEKTSTASEVAIEHREDPALQTSNAVQLGAAPSDASTDPRAENNSSEGGNGKGPQRELGEAELEESGFYFDDFTPDNNDDGKRSGNQEGVEESGSYADDLADDGEEHYDEGDHEEDGGENQTASEGEPFADAEALATGVGVAAPGVVGRGGHSTTEAAEEPVAAAVNAAINPECVTALPGKNDTDVGVHEIAVPELDGATLDGAHCSSDALPERLHTPRESHAVSADDEPRKGNKPQQSVEEDENPALGSGGESPAAEEREIQEDYENDYAEGDDNQEESAKAEVVESIQPGFSSKAEKSGSSSAESTGAGGDGVSATQTTRQSESHDEVLGDVEGDVVGEETGLAQHNTQPADKNDRRSSEAVNSLAVPDETITDESDDGYGVSDAELVSEVTGHEVVHNPQPELVAEADEHRDHASPLDPVPRPTAVDSSKIIENGDSVDEGYGSEFDEAPNEDFHDDFETSDVDKASPGAPKIEAETISATTDSVFELGSERSEVVSEIGAQSVSSTAAGVAEGIDEEGKSTAELGKPAAMEETPSPVERRRSSEGGAPSTSVAQEDDFEESYEDDTGEIDTVTSTGGGENSCQAPTTGTNAPAPEPGSSCEGIPCSASLPVQEFEEGEVSTGGDPDEEQTEADGAVADEGLAVELAKCESSTTEEGDFEEDFDEEFEEDVEEGVTPRPPNEEDKTADLVVSTGQNSAVIDREETAGSVQQDDTEVGIVSSGSEVSNSPASTAAAATTGRGGELSRGDGDEVGGQRRESSRVEESCEIPPPTEEVRDICAQTPSRLHDQTACILFWLQEVGLFATLMCMNSAPRSGQPAVPAAIHTYCL